VLDFTSALYLGFDHAWSDLPGWDRLTLGKPAALESPPGAPAVERDLAALVGCERALLAPSTLHVFGDLFTILAGREVNYFLDDGTYPVARWGAERAVAVGRPVRFFPRHDARALREAIARADRKPPVVVADGFCLACGSSAPIDAYLKCTAHLNGLVVVDDTQALGILGRNPTPLAPFGRGGGGSLPNAGVRDARIVVASSLAKAFGAPLAVLAGSQELVAEFENRSTTRVHCSPPSVAAIAAAGRALALNRRWGDRLRWRLAQLVARFRRGLSRINLPAAAGLFPVQPLNMPRGVQAGAVHRALLDRGIQAVLHRDNGSGERISFVLTARHESSQIDHAVMCVMDIISRMMRRRWKGAKGNGDSTKFTPEPAQCK